MTFIPLAVIAFSSTSAVVTELLQWFFVWRTSGFQALKANLQKHGKAVEDAKDPSASKNLKKKEQRLQSWKAEAGKAVASYNMKAGVVVSGPGGRRRRRYSGYCPQCTAAAAAAAAYITSFCVRTSKDSPNLCASSTLQRPPAHLRTSCRCRCRWVHPPPHPPAPMRPTPHPPPCR